MEKAKDVIFLGSALADLRGFPASARRDADDWKPMATIGQGVQEIRIRDAAGAYRVIYLARLAAAVYVLHCFQKKTEKTSRLDMQTASRRYRMLMKEQGP